MSEKEFRKALLTVKRLNRDTGGDARLKGAIDNFGQQRQQGFNRPANGSQSAALGLDTSYASPPQLLVAEPPQQQRSAPQGMAAQTADFGSALDDGIGMLTGRSDAKPALAKGAPAAAASATSPNTAQPSSGAPNSAGSPNVKALASYIYNRAPKYGIDPNLALGIALREGLNENTVSKGGNPDAGGTSYGPYQLFSKGLAPQFQKDTGLDPSDPTTQQAQVDWSLKYMQSHPKEISNDSSTWFSIRDNHGTDNLSRIGSDYAGQHGGFAQPTQNAGQPTGGPVSAADIPQDTDMPQAKRGGFMRRKHFDDGGGTGDGGDGAGGDSGGDGTAAAAAAAGYGGVGNSNGAPAGTSTNGTGSFGDGMGGASTGFGGNTGFGGSVGIGSPNGSPGGVAAGFGNAGFGGNSAGAATGFGGNGGNGGSPAGAGGGSGGTGPGGTGGGGGTASGGSGVTGLNSNGTPMFGGVPAFYNAGFGLGKGGAGNVAAGQSNTATQDKLNNTQMKFGFVNGNDPGLSGSATGQAALAQSPYSSPAYAQAVNALKAGMAAHAAPAQGSPGGQGFGNAGFGGGSPTASVGGFGGNSAPTGAEGVSTASLGVGPGSPGKGVGPAVGVSGVAGLNSNGTPMFSVAPPAPQQAPQQNAQQQQAPATHAAVQTASAHAERAQQRGGMVQRASGGQIASMPTNEMVARAMQIISRHKAASGGKQTTPTTASTSPASSAPTSAPSAPIYDPTGPITWGPGNMGFRPGQLQAAQLASQTGLPLQAAGGLLNAFGQQAAPQAATPAAAPTTPALDGQTIGNAAGAGAATGAPLGAIPMASPTGGQGMPGSPGAASGTPTYGNTLNEALGTNSPTTNQVFGFNYPVPPPSKPQPQGPVSQAQINAEYGVGDASQIGTGVFASGGAIIMDALTRANSRARKAKGKR